MPTKLPPGPRHPATFQTLAALTRQRPYLERQRRRYGNVFTAKLLGFGKFVMVADPDMARHVFTAPADVLHAGTGSPLKSVLGRHSLLAIDEDRHLEQRRLLLPPFHGKRMQAYEPLIAEVAAAEIDSWPDGREIETAEPFMRITLRAILRAVFGAEGDEITELERVIPPWVELGSRLATLSFLQHDLGPRSPWGRYLARAAEVDAALNKVIERGRRAPDLEERPDVLALLLQATHTDGSPMDDEEIRDQLKTIVAAGHETTGATLAWAIERLRRHPDVLERLVAEADAGGRELRDATIREVQRIRPTIHFAGRLVRKPFRMGDWELAPGQRIALAANLTHFDPALFPQPDVFRPDRFLEAKPETYSWIPFGGGIRRCIGAAFAHMEMDVVLREVLRRVTIEPAPGAPDEKWADRGIAFAPGLGGRALVRKRVPQASPLEPVGTSADAGR